MQRILIVEDDQLVLLDMTRILENNGYKVAGSISRGAEAIKAVKEYHPDVIIMDIELQDDVDGIEAAETLALISAVPVIFVTAHNNEDAIQRIRNTNAAAYLIKPYDEREFLFTVGSVLRNSTKYREARSQTRWFNTILQNIDDGVFVLDTDNTIEYANPLAESIFHLPNSLGKNWFELLDTLSDVGNGVYSTGFTDPSHIEISQTKVSGILDVGKETIVLIRDVSRRYAYEKNLQMSVQLAEEASKAKSAFLANMSHELRTPLNSIIGMAELAQDIAQEPPLNEYLGILKKAANSLLFLINGILDFSKIEAGKMTVDIGPMHLRQLIEEIVGNLAVQAHSKGIDIYLNYNSNTAEDLECDEKKVRQILVNLIGNAIKFTVRGSVTVVVSEDEGHIKIAVQDTGVGISPDKQKSIFNPFVQADGSATRHFGGTGLGLAITARLVELLGGKIHLESALGSGTTFTIELPLKNPVYKDHIMELPNKIVLLGIDPQEQKSIELVFNTLGLALISVEPGDIKDLEKDIVIIYNASSENDTLTEGFPKRIRLQKMDKMQHASNDIILTQPITLDNLTKVLTSVNTSETKGPRGLDNLKTQNPKRILLVEDDKINLLVNSRMLEKIGHRVITAENGEVAFVRLKQYPVDLVLMDLKMPVLDGIEASKKIRNSSLPFKNVPIIALTAHALDADKDRALEAGMDSFLSKPFSPKSLLLAIDQLDTSEKSEDSVFSIVKFREQLLEFLNREDWEGIQQYVQLIKEQGIDDGPDISSYLFRIKLAARRQERESVINLLSDIDEVFQLYLRR